MKRVVKETVEIELHPDMSREDCFSLSKSWKSRSNTDTNVRKL
jgi:hypothetical protein